MPTIHSNDISKIATTSKNLESSNSSTNSSRSTEAVMDFRKRTTSLESLKKTNRKTKKKDDCKVENLVQNLQENVNNNFSSIIETLKSTTEVLLNFTKNFEYFFNNLSFLDTSFS